MQRMGSQVFQVLETIPGTRSVYGVVKRHCKEVIFIGASLSTDYGVCKRHTLLFCPCDWTDFVYGTVLPIQPRLKIVQDRVTSPASAD